MAVPGDAVHETPGTTPGFLVADVSRSDLDVRVRVACHARLPRNPRGAGTTGCRQPEGAPPIPPREGRRSVRTGWRPVRKATSRDDDSARPPSSDRARTRPWWSMTALKPVGDAWTTSRPSAMAWSRAAAISWVGTWLVRYDEVLVGYDEQPGPGPGGDPSTCGVEDLVGHQRPDGARRCVQHAVAVAGDGVEGDAREVGQVGEEAPVGDVLAEGHAVDLLEAGHQPARRRRRPRSRCGSAVADTVSVTPT